MAQPLRSGLVFTKMHRHRPRHCDMQQMYTESTDHCIATIPSIFKFLSRLPGIGIYIEKEVYLVGNAIKTN